MMIETEHNRHELQPEDALRMSRLSEEVRGRLLEMALITARTVGIRLPQDALVKFVPHKPQREADPDGGTGDWMEIMEVDGVEACYGVIGGKAFAESPCGAAG